MKIVKAILWGFIAAIVVGALTQDTLIVTAAIAFGAAVGYGDELMNQDNRRHEQARQAAARQERQARLIADAIAEREARQRLGEFETS